MNLRCFPVVAVIVIALLSAATLVAAPAHAEDVAAAAAPTPPESRAQLRLKVARATPRAINRLPKTRLTALIRAGVRSQPSNRAARAA